MTELFDLNVAAREIRRAVVRACPGWLSSEADDVAQEVLRRIVERNRQGEGVDVCHVSYWRRAAHHALLNEIRRRRLRREERLDDENPEPRQDHAQANDPERQAASRELRGAIGACLRTLTEARRRTVVLFLQGHSVPETAELLGWRLKRAESAVYRGLADLRKCLTGKGWTP